MSAPAEAKTSLAIAPTNCAVACSKEWCTASISSDTAEASSPPGVSNGVSKSSAARILSASDRPVSCVNMDSPVNNLPNLPARGLSPYTSRQVFCMTSMVTAYPLEFRLLHKLLKLSFRWPAHLLRRKAICTDQAAISWGLNPVTPWALNLESMRWAISSAMRCTPGSKCVDMICMGSICSVDFLCTPSLSASSSGASSQAAAAAPKLTNSCLPIRPLPLASSTCQICIGSPR
mmetsp:Transcript_29807/g.85747  ORF Transcript_29807/g.85747 Transcript_29807/m.85747 type:complete len:233 (-) Transcript_29807:504-1202(-)